MTDDHGLFDAAPMSASGAKALSEPIFLIKVGDVYYATLSVWEYNPANAVTEAQCEGCRQVEQYFSQHEGDIVGAAIILKVGDPVTMTSTTKPPRPKPTPNRPSPDEPGDAPADPVRDPTGDPASGDAPPNRET